MIPGRGREFSLDGEKFYQFSLTECMHAHIARSTLQPSNSPTPKLTTRQPRVESQLKRGGADMGLPVCVGDRRQPMRLCTVAGPPAW